MLGLVRLVGPQNKKRQCVTFRWPNLDLVAGGCYYQGPIWFSSWGGKKIETRCFVFSQVEELAKPLVAQGHLLMEICKVYRSVNHLIINIELLKEKIVGNELKFFLMYILWPK